MISNPDPSQGQRRLARSLRTMSSIRELLQLSAATNSSSSANNKTSGSIHLDSGEPTMPAELVKLLNTLFTCAAGVAFTALIQYGLVLLWRHGVNRKYYRMARETAQFEKWHQKSEPGTLPPIPPKFFPFPKSLLCEYCKVAS